MGEKTDIRWLPLLSELHLFNVQWFYLAHLETSLMTVHLQKLQPTW